jgi:hypothetical protein
MNHNYFGKSDLEYIMHIRSIIISTALVAIVFTYLQFVSSVDNGQRKTFDKIYKRSLLDTFGISNSTIDYCFQKYENKSLGVLCSATKDHRKCEGPPDPRMAWLKKCISESIVAAGFQIPVYIVHGPSDIRLSRIKRELNAAGVHHVHVHNKYQASNLNKTEVENFFKMTVPGNGDMYRKCVNVYSATERSKPEETCSKGVTLSNIVLAVGMEHYGVVSQIATCPHEHLHCASPADNPMARYALVFEDDQHIPINIIELVVNMLLNIEERAGLYMLDDSWFWLQQFFPPQHLQKAVFPNSYERNYTRTVGSYLINQHVARILEGGKSFVPQLAPIDFQLNYAVIQEKIPVRWAYPPLTCAGSAGMEETSSTGGYSIWPEFRLNCPYCCNTFFNIVDMSPYLNITLIDQAFLAATEQNYIITSKLEKLNGHAVRSFSGRQGIFLVENNKLRHIPNMDTFNHLGLSMKYIDYFDDIIVDDAPKGPVVPACVNCRR